MRHPHLRTTLAPDAEITRALAFSPRVIGRALGAEETKQFLQYAHLLTRWNRKARLSAITAPAEIARLHFLDSLLCARAEIPAGAQVIDVGSGAGLPGIPLKIVRPDVRMVLLEANARKAAFLESVAREMSIDLQVVHARAEDAGRDPRWRERFDVAVARALAPLAEACELTLPFVRPGGRVVLLKGPAVRGEITSDRRTIAGMGGGVLRAIDAALPGGDGRVVVVVEKNSVTPSRYPRLPGLRRRRPS